MDPVSNHSHQVTFGQRQAEDIILVIADLMEQNT